MRKLASIRIVKELKPIPDADRVELAIVDGWQCVVKKGEFSQGDLGVYFEIDSFIPLSLVPFLAKTSKVREFQGVEGVKLVTVKIRKALSQGLLLPLSFFDFKEVPIAEHTDLTDFLGIQKWERSIESFDGANNPSFPSFPEEIPITRLERVQNILDELKDCDEEFEVTEKVDGSSMTVALLNGIFEVCGHKTRRPSKDSDIFYSFAKRKEIENKMRNAGLNNFAIQGELAGNGIRNSYGGRDVDFYVFNIFDIEKKEYLNPLVRLNLVMNLGLTLAPIIEYTTINRENILEMLLNKAEGESALYDGKREGIVYKSMSGETSFKVINNEYLLDEKD